MADPPPPSLRQIQYLVAVVHHGSFTRAAEALHVAQPSLSQQVRALEATVGAQLLRRGPRAVSPTPAGRAFLPGAERALDGVEHARRAALAAAGLTAGEIRLATTQSLAHGVVPRTLRAWRRERSGVAVHVREHVHLRALHDDLAAGAADVALAQDPGSAWAGSREGLGEEELVVVLADDDPEAGSGPVDLADLADREWVLPVRTSGFAEAVDAACAAAGFAPQAAVRSGSVASLVELAAAGLGPALVPANVLAARPDAVVRRCDPPVRRALAVFAVEGTDPQLVAGVAAAARAAGHVDR